MMPDDLTVTPRPIPAEVKSRRRVWYLTFMSWLLLYYGLGIGAILLSVLTGFLTTTKLLSLGAACCTGLLLFLKPLSTYKAYLRAWNKLDQACHKYRYDSGTTIDSLIEAMAQGEDVIDRDTD